MAHAAGEKLGPYEILSPIGAGGMGEVYKARDTRLDRTVAIKVLPEHIAKREDLRARFEREARAVASLNHPHICTLHDIGDGYMVMELIEGETLAERIEKGPIPLDQALKFATQIADALDRAHRAGVTHRDVKPLNIMLTRDGVKVLDFGLAKSGLKPGPAEETLTKVLTTEGTIMGTPQYMAPELFEGKEADPRSDIWAFGAVLYEMVSGQKAFKGKSYSSLVGAILAADPAPMAAKPVTPAWLERLVRRCLAKDPEDRWQTMRDIVIELRMPPQEAIASAKVARWPWIAAALVVVGALGAGVFWYYSRDAAPPLHPVRFGIELPEGAMADFLGIPQISSDGGKIVVSVGSPPNSQLWIRSLDSPYPRPIPGTEGGSAAIFSPDNRSLAFMRGRELRRLDLDTGVSRTLCEFGDTSARPTSWNRDGVILVHESPVIKRVSASGGVPKAVSKLEAGEMLHHFADFLPDGRHFLYFVFPGGSRTGPTNIGSIDDPKFRKQILKSAGPARYVSPGRLLYSDGNSLVSHSFDKDKLDLRGDPIPITEQPGGNSAISGFAFSASETGSLIWRSEEDRSSQLEWLDRTGRQLSVVGEPGEVANPALSPDDRRALVNIIDPVTRSRAVWNLDMVRGTSSRLTFDPADNFSPVWSPDGTYVYFGSSRKGHRDLYRKRADGTGAEEELLVSDVNKGPQSLSADGKYLLYVVLAKPESLWLLPLIGDRKPTLLFAGPYEVNRGQFSPNSRWITYSSRESGRSQVYVQSAPGSGTQTGKWQVSIAGGDSPQWRRDGKGLFFLAGDKLMEAPVKSDGTSFEAGTPTFMFAARLGTTYRNHFSVSADGQRFLFVSARATKGAQLQVLLNWPALLNRK